MDKIEGFYNAVKTETEMTLATSADNRVTMRIVAPVLYENGILIFTWSNSCKFAQLKSNPLCCVCVGGYYAECKASFLGATMLDANSGLRRVYSDKFPGAFDENVMYGGIGADFVLFKPTRISGWAFKDDIPTEDGIPNEPFDIEL